MCPAPLRRRAALVVALGLGLFFGLGGGFVLFCAFFVGLGAIIGLVEAAAFKDDAAAGAEEAFDGAFALLFGAIGELFVAHLLEDLKGVAAGLAAIVVVRHDNFLVAVRWEVSSFPACASSGCRVC